MKNQGTTLRWLVLLTALPIACSDAAEPALKDSPLCKFDCPKRGVAQGSAAISGVPTADTLFQAAVGYSTAAEHVSAALEAELAQLRTDFALAKDASLGAEIRRQGADVLGASPRIVAGEALCWVDSQRFTEIEGKCDTELEAATTISCYGPCRVEPGTDCGRMATLECTQNATGVLPDPDAGMPNAISGACADLCNGTCTDAPDQGGRCDGTCFGSCDENCDRFVPGEDGAPTCAGRCSGRCDGQCAHAVERATCRGVCTGTCTHQNQPEGCDGAVETRCQPDPGRAFDCPGACAGRFTTPPLANDECAAAAQALASYLARCDAPRVSVQRRPAPDAAGAREQRYLFGLRNLEMRLPELLANVARAKLIKLAGQGFAAASGEIQDSLRAASTDKDVTIQDGAGLTCALAEVPRIGTAIEPAQRRLDAVLSQASELLGAFDIQD